ncbi:MAG: hypothetical protein IPL79_14110 [Myxococcales bacterium]|nr:hypothetical protein [Myxococcales bacterium]
MITLGIDEAGRGPAIGEMVVAAVAVTEAQALRLRALGVADSKSFGAGARAKSRRAELAAAIGDIADFAQLEVATVEVIDERVTRGELNVLERELATALIVRAEQRSGPCARIVADGTAVFGPLSSRHPALEAHNGGEDVHIAVAAASVIAKAKRDALYAEICARYADDFGEIRGGGYLNDATRAFLVAYAKLHGRLLPEARRSWPYPFLATYVTHELRID